MDDRPHSPVGSVDRGVLLAIEERLRTADHVEATSRSIERGKLTLTARLSRRYFHETVREAYYAIRWYTSDDFEIHYQENWRDDRTWMRRWDRHPQDGPREHYHPPPDASHPPEPASYPRSYLEVMRQVERETIEHLADHPCFETGSTDHVG